MPILNNPVLEGYMKGVEERRASEAQQFSQQMQTEKAKRDQEQLSATLENLKHQAAIQDAHIDLGRKEFEFNLHKHVQSGITSGELAYPQNLQGNSTGPQYTTSSMPSGIQQPQFNQPQISAPTPNPQGNISFMGQQFPAAEFTPPDQLRARQHEDLKNKLAIDSAAKIATATGISNAKQPNELEQIRARNEDKPDIAAMNNTSKEQIAQQRAQEMARSTEMRQLIATMHDSTLRTITAMKQQDTGVNADQIHQNALAASLGEADLAGTSKNAMLVRGTLKNMGMVPFGAKEATRLRGMHDIEPLISDMQTMIDKYLPESKSGILGSFLGSKIPSTELKSLNDAIEARTGEITRTVGGMTGRFALQEFKKSSEIMAKPGQTKAAAQMTLDALQRDIANRVHSDILGGVTNPLQKFAILQKEGFDPQKFGGTSSGPKNTQFPDGIRPNFIQGKDGQWKYWEPKVQKWGNVAEIE